MRVVFAGHVKDVEGLESPGPRIGPWEYADWLASQPDIAVLVSNDPYFLDLFGYVEVIVVDKEGDYRSLAAFPRADEFKAFLEAGEFFASVFHPEKTFEEMDESLTA